MGFVGSAAGWGLFRALRRAHEKTALFVAGWIAVVVPAVVVALVLGAQPRLAHRPDGTPLFFPFGWRITLPAVVVPHLVAGVGEGILTVLVVGFVGRHGERGGRLDAGDGMKRERT
jgi:cobalt/nickel transport system permease protein